MSDTGESLAILDLGPSEPRAWMRYSLDDQPPVIGRRMRTGIAASRGRDGAAISARDLEIRVSLVC